VRIILKRILRNRVRECVAYINLVQDTGQSWVAVGMCVDYINVV